MDTAHQFGRIYLEALFAPGILSFALVIALVLVRKRLPAISRRKACALFGIGLFCIAGALPAWQILFPEPCLYFLTKPLSPCWMQPSAIFQMGIFAGLLGALTALLLLKTRQVIARKRS